MISADIEIWAWIWISLLTFFKKKKKSPIMGSTVLYLIWWGPAALAAQRCKLEKFYFQHLKRCECKNLKEQNFFTKKFKKASESILLSDTFFFWIVMLNVLSAAAAACLLLVLLLAVMLLHLSLLLNNRLYTDHAVSITLSLITQSDHAVLIMLLFIMQSDHTVSDHAASFITASITFQMCIMCIFLSQKHQAIIQCHDQSYIHQSNRI